MLFGSFSAAALKSDSVTFALKALGGDKTLDLGGLSVFLLSLTAWSYSAADNKFPDIVLLVQSKELADLGSTLRPEPFGVNNICKAGKLAFTLLYDAKR